MADTKTYVVMATKIGLATGEDPRTGIERVAEARRGDTLTAEQLRDEENIQRLLDVGAIREDDGRTEEQAAADEAEQQEAERLTEKQALQKRAGELGISFEEKTTSAQLKSLIAEEEEKRRDAGPQDGTGNQDAS